MTADAVASARAEPARTSWAVVLVSVLTGLVVAAQLGKLIAALPIVSADLGLGPAFGGVLIGGFTLVGALTGAALGTATGRIGQRRTLLGGLGLVAVGSLLGSAVPSGPLLLATTVIEGAGFTAVAVTAPSMIARAARPADTPVALGLWGTYAPLGQALAILATPLIVLAAGWRGLWWTGAAVAVGCALLAAWVLRALSEPATTSATAADLRRDIGAALRSPGSRLLPLAFGAYALQFAAITGFLPVVYTGQGLGTTASLVATSVVVAMNVLGNLVGGVLLRRGAPTWALICTAAATMGTTAVAIYSLDLPFAVTYALALVFSAVGGLLPAATLAAVPRLSPRPGLVAVVNGLVVQGIGIGMVLGPVAVGALAEGVGNWRATPLVVTTAAALVLLVGLRLRRSELVQV